MPCPRRRRPKPRESCRFAELKVVAQTASAPPGHFKNYFVSDVGGQSMASELIKDWTLAEGLQVEIRLNGESADHGKVEVTTLDGQVLWLEGNAANTRRLYLKAESYDVWTLDIEEKSGGVCRSKKRPDQQSEIPMGSDWDLEHGGS
jgi:hypothetical protein